MNKQTEALKQALEALEWINRVNAMEYEYQQKARESLNAIYEALAEQPAQDNTYGYAKNLAEAIFKQHFASDEHYASGRIVWGVNDTVIGILTQIDNMVADMVRRPAQQQEPVAHSIVAGALFDFMGWLTSRNECLVLSSTDDATPAADAIKDFAHMRNLSIDDAKVREWQEHLASPPASKTEQQEPVAPKCGAIIEVFGKDWRLEYLCLPVGRHKLYTQQYTYTSPPASKPWVGLTDEEYRQAEAKVWAVISLDDTEKEANREFYEAIEAKLREKNA